MARIDTVRIAVDDQASGLLATGCGCFKVGRETEYGHPFEFRIEYALVQGRGDEFFAVVGQLTVN